MSPEGYVVVRRARVRGVVVGIASLAMVAVSLPALAPLTPVAAATPTCNASGSTANGATVPAVADLHSSTMYIGTSGGGATVVYDANYFGYSIKANTAISNLWVKLTNFSGSVVTLAPGQANALPGGTKANAASAGAFVTELAATDTVSTFFLAKATGTTASAQTHTVTVYDGNPNTAGAVALCSRTTTVAAVESTLDANANKVTSIVPSVTSGATLGSQATVTVSGDTGTIGSAASAGIVLAPTAKSDFKADAWRLTSTTITLTNPSPDVTYVNKLYLSSQAANQGAYTASYTFTAVGVTGAQATVIPIGYIASGTQMKYTGSLPNTLPAISAVTNTLSIAKSSSATVVKSESTTDVTYTVTVSNSGSSTVYLDNVVDSMPSGTTFVAASGKIDGVAAAPDVNSSSGTSTLTFSGPIAIPAKAGAVNGTKVFEYQLRIPASVGTFTNSAVGYVGSTVIGTTTSSSTPASVAVTAVAPPTVTPVYTSLLTATAPSVTVTPTVTGTGVSNAAVCLVDPADNVCKATVTVAAGTWTVNTGTGAVTFTPAAGYSGVVSISYRATDAVSQTGTGPVTVNVNPLPVVNPQTGSTAAPNPVTLTMTVLDQAGGSSVTPTAACLVSPASGACVSSYSVGGVGSWQVAVASPFRNVTFTPASGYTGTAVATYVATYGGSQAANTATVTVNPPSAPAVSPYSATTAANTPVSFTPTVTGSSVDASLACVVDPADSVCRTWVYVAGKGSWAVDGGTGGLTFTPELNVSGATEITYRAKDVFGQTGTAVMTVTVGAVPTFTVTYNANGSTGGTVPSDATAYAQNATVTVKSNSGALSKTGYTLSGWTTSIAGTGTVYSYGGANPTFAMGSANVTLYAKWTAATYNVSYDANGGSGSVPASGTASYGATYTILSDASLLTRSGYTLSGWTTSAAGSGTVYSFGGANPSFTMGAGDVTLFAKWTAATYNVAYDGNGSTGGSVPATGSAAYGATYSVAAVGTLTKSGHTFIGWTTSPDGSGTVYGPGTANPSFTMGAAPVTLYAQWSPNNYNITYDGNGKTGGSVPASATSAYGSTYSVSANSGSLTKTGYSFQGWTQVANSGTVYASGSGSPSFTMGAADVTLYASWSTNAYTVHYDGNSSTSGSVASDAAVNYGSTYVVEGQGTLLRTGYSFAGWTTSPDGSGTVYSATGVNPSFAMGAANTTLYAKWMANSYTITYHENGGSSGSAPSAGSFTTGGAAYTVATKPAGMTKAGYAFSGWNTQPGGGGASYAENDTYSTSASLELYAQWTPSAHYTISYDDNASTTGSVPSSANPLIDSTFTVASNAGSLTKLGYDFGGWNTQANGSGTTYAAGTGSFTVTGAMTLYAYWTAKPTYSVTYSLDATTTGTAPGIQNFTTDVGVSIASGSTVACSGAGFNFVGWNHLGSQSSVEYAVGQAYSAAANLVLYPVCSIAPTWTVAYESGGYGTVNSQRVVQGSSVAAASGGALTRTGYTFAHWAVGSSGGSSVSAGTSYTPAADTTMYAVWSPNTYDITYDANGGSSAPNGGHYTTGGSSYSVSGESTMTRSGYAFAGWNTEASGVGGTTYADSAAYSTPANVVLYAQWTPITYTVSFSADATLTSGSVPSSQTFNVASGVVLPDGSAMARAGYTFVKWNTSSGGHGADWRPGDSYTTPGTATLYAVWSLTPYSVVYDANGGSGTAPTAQSFTVDTGVNLAARGDLEKTGYAFGGWNTASNGGGIHRAESASYDSAASVTLFAEWNPITYTVTYQANLGSGTTPAAQTFTVESAATLSSGPALTRTGYTLSKWNTAAGGTGTDFAKGANYATAGNVTLYAIWTPTTYSISYSANGGTGSMVAQTYTVASAASIAANSFTRTGYAFDTWNTSSNGRGVDHAVASSYNTDGGLTLYATWTPLTYVVSYDANGGSGAEPDDAFTVESSTRLSRANGMSRSGYTFAGWNTAPDGTGTSYAGNASYATPGTITLYAVWDVNAGSGTGGGSNGAGGSGRNAGNGGSTGPNVVTPTRRIPSPLDLIVTPTTQSANTSKPVALLEFEPTGVDLQRGDGATLTGNDKDAQTSQDKGANPWDVKISAERPFIGGATTKDPAAVAIDPGTPIQVSGYGFAPNTIAVVYVMDPPIALAVLQVDADGNLVGSVPVPSTLAAGDYRLQVNGYSPNMLVRSLTLGFEIGNKANLRTQRVTTKVYFDPLSPKIDKRTSAALASLVKKLPKGAVDVNVQVLGYVQPTAVRKNDYSLSSNRAMAVAKALAGKGVAGKYYLSGRGRAPQQGAKARRVEVVIAFTVLGS